MTVLNDPTKDLLLYLQNYVNQNVILQKFVNLIMRMHMQRNIKHMSEILQSLFPMSSEMFRHLKYLFLCI